MKRFPLQASLAQLTGLICLRYLNKKPLEKPLRMKIKEKEDTHTTSVNLNFKAMPQKKAKSDRLPKENNLCLVANKMEENRTRGTHNQLVLKCLSLQPKLIFFPFHHFLMTQTNPRWELQVQDIIYLHNGSTTERFYCSLNSRICWNTAFQRGLHQRQSLTWNQTISTPLMSDVNSTTSPQPEAHEQTRSNYKYTVTQMKIIIKEKTIHRI